MDFRRLNLKPARAKRELYWEKQRAQVKAQRFGWGFYGAQGGDGTRPLLRLFASRESALSWGRWLVSGFFGKGAFWKIDKRSPETKRDKL